MRYIKFKMEKIKKYIDKLNDYRFIKIGKTDKTRLIFNNDINNIFDLDNEDYHCNWLSSFLHNVSDLIENEHILNLNELESKIEENIDIWVNIEEDIYSYDLKKWVKNYRNSCEYLNKCLINNKYNDFMTLVQDSQYIAISEQFYNYMNNLIINLKSKFRGVKNGII